MDKFDFQPRKITEQEKQMLRLQKHVEYLASNLAAQIRAICITLNVNPDEFVKNFHDEVGQLDFLNKYKNAEKELIAEYEDRKKSIENITKHEPLLEKTDEEK